MTALFPAERTRLLDLLSGLSPARWDAPTPCPGWTVHDVAAHLLGDDLGRLSRQRDGFLPLRPAPGETLVVFLNRFNADWVTATRRLSPRVLCDLLRWSGDETQALFQSLDPLALGEPVSWTGPGPAPIWLDIAREYTERWHHQAHIRAAVGALPLSEPRLFAPVLATFVRVLPYAYRGVDAPEGATVQLSILGDSGGDWTLLREGERWTLWEGAPDVAAASVTIAQDDAWRLFTKGLTPEDAARAARIEGDAELGRPVLSAVAIIA